MCISLPYILLMYVAIYVSHFSTFCLFCIHDSVNKVLFLCHQYCQTFQYPKLQFYTFHCNPSLQLSVQSSNFLKMLRFLVISSIFAPLKSPPEILRKQNQQKCSTHTQNNTKEQAYYRVVTSTSYLLYSLKTLPSLSVSLATYSSPLSCTFCITLT